jgi:hypothetical protein
MSNCSDKLGEYLIEMEEREKEFETDAERFYYGLSDKDIDYLLDCRERADDMGRE